MKRLYLLALLLLLAPSIALGQASTPISALPAATTLSGTEVAPIVQSSTTKKATATQIATVLTLTANTWGGTQTVPTLAVTSSAGGNLKLGAQATGIGSGPMRIDNSWTDGTDASTEGNIWSTRTYAANAWALTATAGTITGQGSGVLTNAPITSGFFYLAGNGATADLAPVLTDCNALVNGTSCFGANFIARNNANTVSATLRGLEVDVEFATGSTDPGGSAGYYANIFNISSAAAAMQFGGVGGGTWGNGIVGGNVSGSYLSTNSGNTVTAHSFMDLTNAGARFSDAAIKLGTGAANAIDFGGGAFGTDTYLYGDTSHNLNLNIGSGQFFVMRNPSGTIEVTFDLGGGTITPVGGVKYPYFTVATLPACAAGNSGLMLAVSDATAPTYRGALTGGGTVKVPVFCDGTSWTSH